MTGSLSMTLARKDNLLRMAGNIASGLVARPGGMSVREIAKYSVELAVEIDRLVEEELEK